MRLLLVVSTVISLCGCDPQSPSDTVDSLVKDPDRLKVLREQCRLNRAHAGEELCVKVGQATTQRFLKPAESSDGKKEP
ncbi:EexN family lipoprotein [Pseudomonas aeruginosa]